MSSKEVSTKREESTSTDGHKTTTNSICWTNDKGTETCLQFIKIEGDGNNGGYGGDYKSRGLGVGWS